MRTVSDVVSVLGTRHDWSSQAWKTVAIHNEALGSAFFWWISDTMSRGIPAGT